MLSYIVGKARIAPVPDNVGAFFKVQKALSEAGFFNKLDTKNLETLFQEWILVDHRWPGGMMYFPEGVRGAYSQFISFILDNSEHPSLKGWVSVGYNEDLELVVIFDWGTKPP
jgi:hypothetical protein